MKVAIIYNKDIHGVINTFGMQNKEFYNEKTVKRVAECLTEWVLLDAASGKPVRIPEEVRKVFD